ncbi:MAG: hypothetical protein MUO76_19660 [Anaerolineaceae bacterium]|nr:hypothetical protein [Anaerolineaceae bacterium]
MTDLYNPRKLFTELAAAGLPVVSVNSNGETSYTRVLDEIEIGIEESIIQAHDPIDAKEVIQDEIKKVGITDRVMLDALWAKVMDGDSKDADALKVIIDQIKTEII